MARVRNRKRADGGGVAVAGGWRRFALAFMGLVAVAGIAVGSVHGLRALSRLDALRIRTIRFEGLTRATADELLALSPVRPGDHLLGADLEGMASALSRHPWVRTLTVRRRWPPSLEVRISERKAAALVDLGGLYLVDDEGNVFKRASPGDGLDLPLVTGIARPDFLERRESVEPLLSGALSLARAWREMGADLPARLSEIHVEDGDGTTLYVGDEGTEVRLGAGDVQAKLKRLEKVLAALRAEGKTAAVLHLDNRQHPSWVTVRMASADAARAKGRSDEAAPERSGRPAGPARAGGPRSGGR